MHNASNIFQCSWRGSTPTSVYQKSSYNITLSASNTMPLLLSHTPTPQHKSICKFLSSMQHASNIKRPHSLQRQTPVCLLYINQLRITADFQHIVVGLRYHGCNPLPLPSFDEQLLLAKILQRCVLFAIVLPTDNMIHRLFRIKVSDDEKVLVAEKCVESESEILDTNVDYNWVFIRMNVLKK